MPLKAFPPLKACPLEDHRTAAYLGLAQGATLVPQTVSLLHHKGGKGARRCKGHLLPEMTGASAQDHRQLSVHVNKSAQGLFLLELSNIFIRRDHRKKMFVSCPMPFI
jgi:hypothetical protein